MIFQDSSLGSSAFSATHQVAGGRSKEGSSAGGILTNPVVAPLSTTPSIFMHSEHVLGVRTRANSWGANWGPSLWARP